MDVHVHILEPLSDIDSRQELANLSHQLIEAKIKDEVIFSEM